LHRHLSLLILFTTALAYGQALPVASNLYMRVRVSDALKTSKLKPGDRVEGTLTNDVYSGAQQVFAAGSRVQLTVDQLERRRRVPNDHWPWVVQAFTPRHQNFPVFHVASIVSPDGRETALQVTVISVRNERPVEAPDKQAKKAAKTKPQVEKLVTMEAAANVGSLVATEPASGTPVQLPAGTQGKVILLGDLSAGKSKPGDAFQARVVEPVRLDSSVVIPEGTVLTGKVVRRTPPRMLSRAGSLLLSFTDLTVPGGVATPVEASISRAELDQRSHTRIDPEGVMHGERPGKAWMAINLGVTGGIAKEVDDGTQLLIEAVVSTATDASTAGTARIAGICASTLFVLTRHGRDVVLPQYTEMNIVFNRPVSLPAFQAPAQTK